MRISFLPTCIVIILVCKAALQGQTFKNDSLHFKIIKPKNWVSAETAADFAKTTLNDDRANLGIYSSNAFIDFSKHVTNDKDSLLASIRIFIKHNHSNLNVKDLVVNTNGTIIKIAGYDAVVPKLQDDFESTSRVLKSIMVPAKGLIYMIFLDYILDDKAIQKEVDAALYSIEIF